MFAFYHRTRESIRRSTRWPRSARVIAMTVILASCEVADAPPPAQAGEDSVRTAATDPEAVRPFEIQVADDVLADLRERLGRRRLPDQIPGTSWGYGTDRDYVEELLAYWEHEFDWRARERQLNELDQFKTSIEGLDIHFVHQRSDHPDAVPLLITHGWPGSFIEFQKIIGPLVDPVAHGGEASDAFHLVIPSLPGFGFSDRPRERGFNPERMAEILAALMERLGYERYGVQGGDWGAINNRSRAATHPDRLVGMHMNFVIGATPPDADDPEAGVPVAELQRMRERQSFMADERGYQGIQGTKPQTLGYGLNDSPAGLVAWIVEKFHGWSDIDGDIESKFTKDELLTNITLYWLTQTITSSTRIYFESRNVPASGPVGFIEVPTAGAIFPAEIVIPPRRWAEARYNIVRWTEMPRGGHFAALEEPELLIEDVRAFFRDLR